ncbi:MAG: ATP-binding protein [Longimicrobiales bacterium]
MSPERLSRPWRILVVDDDEVDRMAIRRALRDTQVPADLHEVGSVREAADALRDHDFDCALVDYHLPDGDGRDVLAVRRRIGRSLPVVMVTGRGDEGLAVAVMKEGADDYLTKGTFDADALVRSVRYAMGVHRARKREEETVALNRALAEAGERFGMSLDYDATLEAVAGLFAPGIADHCLLVTARGSREAGRAEPDTRDASVLECPIGSAGRELGRLRLTRRSPALDFSDLERGLVTNLADRAGAALDNALLFAELEEQSEVVVALNAVGRTLAVQLDPMEIASTVVGEGLRLTGATLGALFDPGAEGDKSGFVYTSGAGEPPAADRAWLGVLDTEATVWGDAAEREFSHPFGPDARIGSYLAVTVPAAREDGPIGLFFAHPEPDAFGERAVTLADGLAGWAGVALGNARLFRRVSDAVRVRDDVLGIVSHDLRNPLGVILASAGLLLDLDLDPATQRRELERVRTMGTRMNFLIQDLLDVTRMDADTFSVYPREVSVRDVLHEVEELMSHLAEGEGVRLVREEVPEDLRAVLDRDRIAQLLGNLIGNGLKFTPEGGEVRFGACRDGSHLCLHVADTGAGIPEEQIPHLFDRYWQGGVRKDDGAGLGLPICKGIAEAHGGTIEVDASGGGATFTVRIPPLEPWSAGGS